MQKKILLCLFFISLPVILYALILIQPTFDDWTYITTPYFGNPFDAERILPWNGYWRPFDALIGSILGLNHHLFPALNHCLILLAHTTTTIIVYHLSGKRTLPAAFFFLSPAMLGTVLDIDSINQAYATLWGMLSLMLYMKDKKWQWMACVIIATFCKENGIMFAIIPPLITYIQKSQYRNVKPYFKDLMPMMVLIIIYATTRLLLTSTGNGIKDDYTSATLMDHAKDLVQFLVYTWVPMDYEAIVYQPTRNILLAIITLACSIPFLVLFTKALWHNSRNSTLYALTVSLFLAAAPHLLTLFSIMHTYAALGIAAMIIALVYPTNDNKHRIAACLFIVAATVTDIHHWYAAYQSGLIGKEMAYQVIKKSKTKPQKIYVLNIDNGEKKYSIFNVIPRDAFGWGRSVQFYSDYTIGNELISDTTITLPHTPQNKQRIITNIKEKNKSYDAIWLVNGTTVNIIK